MLDKRLMNEIKNNKAYFVMMCFFGLLNLLFSFSMAFLLADIVNSVFWEGASFEQSYMEFAGVAGLILVKSVITYYFHKYFKIFASKQKNKILLNAIADLLKRGPINTREEAAGGIVTSWIESADQIEPFYSEYLPQFFVLAISAPLLLAIVFFCDWITALIMLFTGPLLPFFMMLIGMHSKEANKARLEVLSRLGDSMLDFLNGIRTLKMYGGLEGYRKIITDNSEKFRKTTMEVLRISFLSAFVLELAATISTAMIAVSLGIRLLYDRMEFFPAFFILLLTPDYYMAIRKFGAKFHTAMGAKTAADNLFTNRDSLKVSPKAVSESAVAIGKPVNVTVNHISYKYTNSGIKALKDVSLTFEPGKVSAIVGKSGSGKSTLAYLLMKFIEGEGYIYFNQEDISGYSPEAIRSLIAYIPQKPHVFQDTLRNNLLHSRENASEADLWEALKKATLGRFVQGLPQGMDTVLTEIGSNISVGEAQRLAFARAYLKNCPIIILDESTSALDEENEALLRETFEGLAKNRTIIVIAHRLETVKKADIIYVLEHGELMETGNHTSLYNADGIYRQLVEIWEG